MLIPGYNLVITDHPASIKGGDVCIYFQKSQPLKIFKKNLNFEIRIMEEVCNLISLYRSPNLLKNLKYLQTTPSLTCMQLQKFGIVDMHIGFIQRAINYFPCERSLPEKHVNEKTYILAKAIKNIFSNFIIPHETVLCNYRDPQWISNKIKRKIFKEKNTARQSYVQNRKNE